MISTLMALYPYPAVRPNIPKVLGSDGYPQGWCHGDNVAMFKEIVSQRISPVKLTVDGGSWMGLSAYRMLELIPVTASVICLDTWQGSIEHQTKEFKNQLDHLYDKFIVNLWELRSRVIPVRMSGRAGLEMLHNLGIVPDIIYIDMSHDADNVCQDTVTAMTLFPTASICGDDIGWESVKKGLLMVKEHYPVDFKVYGCSGWLLVR